MSFLDPNASTDDIPDVDPATFDAEDTELVSLAEQLRTQLEEIDGKRADISKRRAEAGPSRAQIRADFMEEMNLFDDDDDPMPTGIKRILDGHVKEWQRTYRERARDGKLPVIRKDGGGVAGTGVDTRALMGDKFMPTVTREIDDWFTSRANSRNRRGADAVNYDSALVDRLYEQTRTGRNPMTSGGE
ncbi:hypothetical protein [Streptomyces sp. B1I3]|uniref:hypothetical protein n=1 Tax=Streptomyces sp. B1I3 TaxID=3042264 RepID=UPI0027810570|nr:hypothetical protein [Streptomyces sp. B1I3]MDQ0793677.1 hypothetical protein [Streptomyces sp. B1I3]